MGKIAIKPTEYKGIKFRSRLEARVAVFFDTCGIKWEYEPEAIDADGSEYNPDFYLPETNDWVEVKGTRPGWEKEIKKACSHVSLNGPITRLVIISEIPNPWGDGLPHFPCYYATTERDPYAIKAAWYFFQDVERGVVRGHISSSWKDVPPLIDPFYLDQQKASITPEVDIGGLRRRYLRLCKTRLANASGIVFESHVSMVKRINPTLFYALNEARQYDFVMKE